MWVSENKLQKQSTKQTKARLDELLSECIMQYTKQTWQ